MEYLKYAKKNNILVWKNNIKKFHLKDLGLA